MSDWHNLDIPDVLRTLRTDRESGLSDAGAAGRLREEGPNELPGGPVLSPWRILLSQFASTMVAVLLVAAAVSALLRDPADAAAILAIVVLNALLGFAQEYRAEKAVAALRRLAAPEVRVRRDGRVLVVPARNLVPGDIVLLEAGARVPADARLIEGHSLRVDESPLTGESAPVEKSTEPLPDPDLPLADRRNCLHLGTTVVHGRGTAVVTATGAATELGRVARMLSEVRREPTPLQRRMARLGRDLSLLALAIVAVLFGMGLLRGEDPGLLILTAVSLAVAAVPEGLPAVVTVTLALGSQRMLARRALIRRLPAVETLGSVTVICSDKTGTLTRNRMAVAEVASAGERASIGGGDAPPSLPASHAFLAAACALCNDAVVPPPGGAPPLGDPTEVALAELSARVGLPKGMLEERFPRRAEVPFTSERKRMTTVHEADRKHLGPAGATDPAGEAVLPFLGGAPAFAITKGAADGLLPLCDAEWTGDGARPLSPAGRERILAEVAEMADRGLRVLGVAFRPLPEAPDGAWGEVRETGLAFLGHIGMIDPPRPEAAAAVATCRAAGIRPVMITGDHPRTALAVARTLGIDRGAPPVTGAELSRMTPGELAATARGSDVYARVSPEHKLAIVSALRADGHVVAMTGDGVNDAPALRKADIGVAMGESGTDVAREASDMVLTDDNFATIVAAVEEGRVIYDNVRKFVLFILASNVGEILVMFLGPLLGMPLPLLPLQILWINLLTDGLPALALGMEPAEVDVMRRPPRPPEEGVLGRGTWGYILAVGTLLAVLCLLVALPLFRAGDPAWRTALFTTLTLAQMAHVLAIRSVRDPLYRRGLLSNRPLLLSVGVTVLLQLAVVYAPPLQAVFRTVALPMRSLGLCTGAGVAVFLAVEAGKFARGLARGSARA
ncbi:MAG TPA: cation-translocating P-type ATPase [Candidatus Deferrimicrobiaceae bacterium]